MTAPFHSHTIAFNVVDRNSSGRSKPLVVVVLLFTATAVGGLLWFTKQKQIRSRDAEQLALARGRDRSH